MVDGSVVLEVEGAEYIVHSSLPPARRRRLKGCNSSLHHCFFLPYDGNDPDSWCTFVLMGFNPIQAGVFGSKFDHHRFARPELVANLATRWRHLPPYASRKFATI